MSLATPVIPRPRWHRATPRQRAAAGAPGAVIILAAGAEGYGIQRGFLSLAGALTRSGRQPTFALLSRGGLHKVLEADAIPVVYAPRSKPVPAVAGGGWRKYVQICRRVAHQLRAAPWLARQVRRRAATTLIVRSPLEVYLAAWVAWRTGIRAYWMMPNLVSATYPWDINRRVYRFMFRHMNLVPIANSRYTASTLGEGDFERHVVHLGIDVDAFAPDRPAALGRADLGLPPHAVVLGIMARMVPAKGQRVVIEAVAQLGEAGRDIHLLLCGGPLDAPYTHRLRARADELGLADRVHIIGPVDDVAAHYQLCDAVVNACVGAEPFGFSVIEAMAMAKPVLAHRAGGPGETVIDGTTGWLVDEPTPEAFAAALNRVLADRPRWPEMSRAAHDHAAANFSADRMLTDLERVIRGADLTATATS